MIPVQTETGSVSTGLVKPDPTAGSQIRRPGSCLAQPAVARVQTKHVPALHAGGVAQLHVHWLRSCRLLREPRHVHLPRAGTTRNYAHVLCVATDKLV